MGDPSAEPAPPPAPAPKPPVGMLVLLGLGGFLYALMLSTLTSVGSSDAAGNALGSAFAAIEGALLWLVSGILLLIGGV
jgi:hypothetical protein